MILAGGIMALTPRGSLFGGVWLAFIGWMLVQASQATYQQVRTEQQLQGVSVGRIMAEPRAWVPPFVTLEAAAHDYFLANNARCLPVAGGGDDFEGVVCLSDLQRTPRSEWGHDRVNDVMTPRQDVVVMDPEQPAVEALRLMSERNINQVAVVDREGKLLGFVDRAAALEYLRVHEMLTRDQNGRREG